MLCNEHKAYTVFIKVKRKIIRVFLLKDVGVIINLKTAGNTTTHLNVLLDLPSSMFFKGMKTW